MSWIHFDGRDNWIYWWIECGLLGKKSQGWYQCFVLMKWKDGVFIKWYGEYWSMFWMCDWVTVVGGECGVQFSILRWILDIQVYMLIRQLGPCDTVYLMRSWELHCASPVSLHGFVYYNALHIVSTQVFSLLNVRSSSRSFLLWSFWGLHQQSTSFCGRIPCFIELIMLV